MTDRSSTSVSSDASAAAGSRRGIIVLDMSYTLAMIQQRELRRALDSRALEGYFDDVISVHPLAGLFGGATDRYGPPKVSTISDGHVFIEGTVGTHRGPVLLAPFRFLAAQYALLKLVTQLGRERGSAVVRIGDPYYLGIVGWLLARRLDVPLAIRVPFRYDELRRVTGRATMPRLFRYGWVEKLIERFVFPRCDLIAGANEDNMRYGLENGGRAEVATVFRYGNLLHPDHWTPPAERPNGAEAIAKLGLTGHRFVATVARLEPMKRVEDAVRVLGELRRQGADVHALLIGDGNLRDDIRALARSLGVEDRTVFAGNRDQRWIAQVLPHASAIVSPHMGRALVEAALSAVPLVAYDYDWQREIVVNDETGYLVADGDWRAMAAMTKQLLDAPARAAALGQGARARAAAMMDPDALAAHEKKTYTALFARWAGRRAGRSGGAPSTATVMPVDRSR